MKSRGNASAWSYLIFVELEFDILNDAKSLLAGVLLGCLQDVSV